MADAPYNPETGEWKVFQDPRQQQRAKSRTATVPMSDILIGTTVVATEVTSVGTTTVPMTGRVGRSDLQGRLDQRTFMSYL